MIAKDMDGWVCSEKYTGIRATSRDGHSWLWTRVIGLIPVPSDGTTARSR
ncbi:hypothetical protein [Paenibacillus thiaminolyticus]|nr:hypothetical protein [Paenibacillus thiaminolyticus]